MTIVGGTSINYQPAADFFGQETFTYTVNDGTPGSNDSATVIVTVTDEPESIMIIDNGDAGFSTTGSWVGSAGGYQGDNHYNAAGSGSDVATWTFTGLLPGLYMVSATWSPHVNRATDSPYRILDGTTEIFSTTVNQEITPQGDVVDSGVNFQHLGNPVTITSGTLVVQLSDDANQFVIADAIRAAVYVDTAAPTASMSNPTDGATVTPASLNSQGYLQVTYDDIGHGLDAGSINGDEISISGTGVGSAVLSGTVTLVSGTTLSLWIHGRLCRRRGQRAACSGFVPRPGSHAQPERTKRLELYCRNPRHNGSDRIDDKPNRWCDVDANLTEYTGLSASYLRRRR